MEEDIHPGTIPQEGKHTKLCTRMCIYLINTLLRFKWRFNFLRSKVIIFRDRLLVQHYQLH